MEELLKECEVVGHMPDGSPVRVWGRALSEDEVMSLWLAAVGPQG